MKSIDSRGNSNRTKESIVCRKPKTTRKKRPFLTYLHLSIYLPSELIYIDSTCIGMANPTQKAEESQQQGPIVAQTQTKHHDGRGKVEPIVTETKMVSSSFIDTMETTQSNGHAPSSFDSGQQQQESPSILSDVNAMMGYAHNIFEGKEEQLSMVRRYLREEQLLPTELIDTEADWFYHGLGIDDYYFTKQSVATIAMHITALYGAKVIASVKKDPPLSINLEHETEDAAVYIHNSMPGISQTSGPMFEKRIDTNYFDCLNTDKVYRLETYRTRGTVSANSPVQLRCYFLTRCSFQADRVSVDETDLKVIADATFLQRATDHTIEIYQNLMKQIVHRTGPVIQIYDYEGSDEKRLVIGYRRGHTRSFFSALSDLYHYYHLYSTRKYVEQFANGVTIISLYLRPMMNVPEAPAISSSIVQILKEASLIYCLPSSALQPLFQQHKMSLQEIVYGHVGWLFSQHFLNRLGSDYATLAGILDMNNPAHVDVLNSIKKRLRQDTFTSEYILDILLQYPELIKACYTDFAEVHHRSDSMYGLKPSLSVLRLEQQQTLSRDELFQKIKQTVSNPHEQKIFEALLIFNQHTLRTNFYQLTKVALSFRLDPSFLPEIEYPTKLFGMFFIVGNEFRGFHLRFRDVARGGIRIIKSQNKEAYGINLRNLFDENYNLAATQQRKNKDIPEGGSKGTILLDIQQHHQQPQPDNRTSIAFEKYIDSLLDLLLIHPNNNGGEQRQIVDLYGKPEILFLGPDENTADFMNWASLHARKRQAPFWKAFTTGKSQIYGGIPHDAFGMTTRSIHQYVLGILKKLGLNEHDITKFQTGGPDGDLGSNEIKISRDKTIAIVDGNGVLYDPIGIDRGELLRLAQQRQMISHFDLKKLSPHGFRILITDKNITLPDGTFVDSGMRFRNGFHLEPQSSATLFVPCGGRPEAVDVSNVHRLYDAEGKPRFKYIVEGANLFFTQDARLRLEKSGVIIFKDASANKGGVTSSSLEVLAALSLNDIEFEEHMRCKPGCDKNDPMIVPSFYQDYVREVQAAIEHNATLEFECLWNEHERTGLPFTVLSDNLSKSIIRLRDDLQTSALWNNHAIRRAVFADAFPKTLQAKLGIDILMRRVPEPYQQALFASYLASRFIYRYGTESSQFAFFEFMDSYLKRT